MHTCRKTVSQLIERLRDIDGPIAAAMLECAQRMTNEDMDAIGAHDASALCTHWKEQLGGFVAHEQVASVVAQLERSVPYVYTKLKSIRLQGNESLLTYLTIRRLVLEELARVLEEQAREAREVGNASTLSGEQVQHEDGDQRVEETTEEEHLVSSVGARPEIEVRRAQMTKQKCMCRFETNSNRVSAVYRKRRVLARNHDWEAQNAAVRVSTVPHGYIGDIWS